MPVNVEAKEPSTMRPADTVTDRRRLGATPRALAAVAALVVVGILVAGCGGGSKSPGVANVSHYEHHQQPHVLDVDYERRQCARRRRAIDRLRRRRPEVGFRDRDREPAAGAQALGVHARERRAELPGPQRAGGDPGQRDRPELVAVPEGPADLRQAPRRRPRHPQPGADRRRPRPPRWRSRSACARTAWPASPTRQFSSGGGISIRIAAHAGAGGNNGLDPNSPIFQKAQQSCGSLLPGRAVGRSSCREYRGPDRSR